MLFVTNRALIQGSRSPGEGEGPREVDFDLNDNNALQSLFFCRRIAKGKYEEIYGENFLNQLRESKASHLLLYIHGFANFPEDAIFQRAEHLQALFDKRNRGLVEVVPVIWPCRNSQFDISSRVVGDYFADQQAADASGFAFARALMKLVEWQTKNIENNDACLKRVSVLAHSMGNRVLVESLRIFCESLLRQDPPMFLRNAFMVAADVVNEIFEHQHPGRFVSFASASTAVYYASDDMALRASKVTNIATGIASRRLGHTGPEDFSDIPRNIVGIDCGDFNNTYDPSVGHTYFLSTDDQSPKAPAGVCFDHMAETIEQGTVPQIELQNPRLVRLAKTIVKARKKAATKKSS